MCEYGDVRVIGYVRVEMCEWSGHNVRVIGYVRVESRKKDYPSWSSFFKGALCFTYLKLIFVRLRLENLSFPVFIGYNSS